MKTFPLVAFGAALSVVLLPFVTPSCGGATSTPPTETGGGAGAATVTAGVSGSDGRAGSTQQGGSGGTTVTPTDTCVANDDCTWGEIPNEILKSTDCICLYGCGYLPQTKVTAARRRAQYQALCNPTISGTGQPCGIDDCALPGGIACVDGTCKAAPRDGG